MADKLNKLFTSIFTVENVMYILVPWLLFLGRVFEELSEIKVIKDEVLGSLGNQKLISLEM